VSAPEGGCQFSDCVPTGRINPNRTDMRTLALRHSSFGKIQEIMLSMTLPVIVTFEDPDFTE
jgi:hypothetical protein